jgi:hypothetical protein
VLQSYFWDGAIVGMYGIRHDNVKSWTYDGTRVYNRVNFAATDTNGDLVYSTAGKTYNLYRANSPSWSVVAKLNKFFGRYGERFPIKASLFYNESRNFQVTTARNDIYGNALPAPSGSTKDYGIMLSTRDERFMFKINKYRTTVLNATNTTGIPTWFLLGSGNFIMRNEDRADAYENHLTILGNANSVAETGTAQGTWVWRYSPRTINGVTETQAEADALSAAAVSAWRAYAQEPIVQKILAAWGFTTSAASRPPRCRHRSPTSSPPRTSSRRAGSMSSPPTPRRTGASRSTPPIRVPCAPTSAAPRCASSSS